MATVSITTTAAQDAAILKRTQAYNAHTGQNLTAVQFGRMKIETMFNSWVSDDAQSALQNIRDRWERSTQAQRDAALALLEP